MNILSLTLLIVTIGASALHAQLATALDLNDRGNQASEAGRPDEAIGLYRDALAIWRASGPDYDAHRAGTLFNLGIAVSAAGNRPEAAKVLEEALVLHRKTLGERNLRTIANMNLLASNYLMIGKAEQAEALFREALPLARDMAPRDIQTARALEGISSVLVRRGQAAEAIAPGEEALSIAIQVAGENSLDAALAYANVGEAHRGAGHSERALPLFRKSRALYEKTLGPEHPRVAALLSQEGLLLLEDRKPASAEQLMTQALSTLDRGCPKCVVERAIAENNLAVLRLQQKRYADAGQLLTHVITLRENYTATPGPELAETLRLLAVVRQKEKRFDDAERLTRRANVILGYR
jgi:tetratricopeptide (TPR) repeat protein